MVKDSGMTIRDARPADAPAIGEILRSLGWFEHLDEIPAEKVTSRIAQVITEKCVPGGDHTLLVAEGEADRVVGYLFVHWLPNLIFGGEGYVSELFVLPDERGHGFGTALLDEARWRGVAHGYQRLSLFNRRERESYQRGFYPRHGWVERSDAALFMYYLDEEG